MHMLRVKIKVIALLLNTGSTWITDTDCATENVQESQKEKKNGNTKKKTTTYWKD